MACTALSRARVLDCSRTAGGIKYVYFSVFSNFAREDWAVDSTNAMEIDDIDFNTSNIYRYAFPVGSASFTDTITASDENGTISYTPTLNLVLSRINKEDQNEIKLLCQSRVRVFIQLQEELSTGTNVILAAGMINGMSVTSGSIDSGQALGDKNGYTLTLTGQEPTPSYLLEDYTLSTGPFSNTGFENETVVISN